MNKTGTVVQTTAVHREAGVGAAYEPEHEAWTDCDHLPAEVLSQPSIENEIGKQRGAGVATEFEYEPDHEAMTDCDHLESTEALSQSSTVNEIETQEKSGLQSPRMPRGSLSMPPFELLVTPVPHRAEEGSHPLKVYSRQRSRCCTQPTSSVKKGTTDQPVLDRMQMLYREVMAVGDPPD
jgi:hypothetical protein